MRLIYSLFQKSIELAGRFGKRGVYVLMLHHVVPRGKTPDKPEISVSEDTFKALIEKLGQSGFKFISPEALESAVSRKSVLITFDDVCSDALETAVPYLIKEKLPFTAFISEGFVGKHGYITAQQAESLARCPLCTVGYHSRTHGIFRGRREEEIRMECDCSDFEHSIQTQIQYFAFPYGSVYACGFKKAKIIKDLYEYSFSTINTRCTRFWLKRYPCYLPRMNMSEESAKRLLKKL